MSIRCRATCRARPPSIPRRAAGPAPRAGASARAPRPPWGRGGRLTGAERQVDPDQHLGLVREHLLDAQAKTESGLPKEDVDAGAEHRTKVGTLQAEFLLVTLDLRLDLRLCTAIADSWGQVRDHYRLARFGNERERDPDRCRPACASDVDGGAECRIERILVADFRYVIRRCAERDDQVRADRRCGFSPEEWANEGNRGVDAAHVPCAAVEVESFAWWEQLVIIADVIDQARGEAEQSEPRRDRQSQREVAVRSPCPLVLSADL